MKILLIMTFMSGCQPPEVDGDDSDDSVGDDNYNDDGDDDAFARLLDIFWIHGYPFVLRIYFARLLVPWISWNVLSLLVSQMAVFYAPNKVPLFETPSF